MNTRLAALEAERIRDPEGGDDSDEEAIETIDGSDGEGPELRMLR